MINASNSTLINHKEGPETNTVFHSFLMPSNQNGKELHMRLLSISGIVLSAIVLLIHIFFNLKDFMPVLMANILIAIFSLTLLLGLIHLLDQKEKSTTN